MKGSFRRLRTVLSRLGAVSIVALGGAACLVSSGHGTGELESRFATIHNALTGIGMSEIGALHDARLGDGQEAAIDLELAPGCTTIVAVGGTTIKDLDASLVDPAGTRIARGFAHTSDATIRACVEAAGHYTLRVKAMRGAGSLLVSTWSGGGPVETGMNGARPSEPSAARGTCEAPLALSAGDFTGSTAHGERENDPKERANSTGAELVYKVDVPIRQKLLVAVETQRFDSILYVRKGDCADKEAEVAYNDDASPTGTGPTDQRHSRIEQVLDPGSYYVFVDSYNANDSGAFKMHVELTDVPPLAELCNQAALLAEGTPVQGTMEGAFDEAGAACGEGAHGPDVVYGFPVDKRSRVRIVMHSDDFTPVVHLRAECDDPDSAVGCSDSGGADHEAAYVGVLDAGRYAVFADSSQRGATGKFTLTAQTAPELGAGTRGERCADAIPLTANDPTVTGDTFTARDDVAGQCGGTGAPDVVYRMDVAARARFTARLTHEEGSHVLVLMRGCGGPKAELACGKTIDRILQPGAYFIAVDGDSPESFGTFAFEWSKRDVQAQDVACKSPRRLREGETISGSTSGAGVLDKFSPSCASSDGGGGAPDVVYELVVSAREHVHLRLRPAGWGAVLLVRKTCLEVDAAAANANEIECHAEENADLEFDGVLDPGKYYVVVDGKDPQSAGTFTLEYQRVR